MSYTFHYANGHITSEPAATPPAERPRRLWPVGSRILFPKDLSVATAIAVTVA